MPSMFHKKSSEPPSNQQIVSAVPEPEVGILDRTIHESPSAQNALDLFKDCWTSSLPGALGLHAGHLPTFDDPRIRTVLTHLGSIKNTKVLELGPLEGGHTRMLHEAGARVIAIEAGSHAFLKCLVVKEILSLNRAHFFLGDFVPYLQTTNEWFDLVLASGVLYHQTDPIGLLESIARVTNRVAIWTHYWDERVAQRGTGLSAVLAATPTEVVWRDRSVNTHSLRFQGASGNEGAVAARWLERDGLLTVLTTLGFDNITVLDDQPDHAAGPAILLVAER